MEQKENLREIQKIVFEEYKKNGYLLNWGCHTPNIQPKIDLAELGLIVTEVSEAMEAIRTIPNLQQQKTNLGFECADIIIRTLNFMSRNAIDATFFINAKNEINMNRGKLHGKAV